MKVNNLYKIAVVLSSGWPCVGAYAQSATGPEGQETTAAPVEAGSADIIVTAQRRSARLQDVPIAVASLSGDQVRERGITASVDIAQVTTGVVIQQTDGRVDPYIRGLGSKVVILGEVGSVATYVDGVYMPEVYGGTYSLANIESIEVLKGPQGTLFGRNTAGGAVVIRTRDPQFTPEGRIEVGYGNLNAVAARGYATGPISDDVAISLTGNYNRRDSYYRDLVRGGRIADTEEYTLRGKLLIRPADNLEIVVAGDHARSEDPTSITAQPTGGYLGATESSLTTSGPRQYIGDLEDQQRLAIQSGVAGTIRLDLSDVTLTSITAYRYSRIVLNIDDDRTPLPIFNLYDRQPSKVFSQEVLLSSGSDKPLTWVVGGYYADQKARYDPLIISGINNLTLEAKANTQIYALFGEATWHLGDFELTGGLRFNRDEKSYSGGVNGVTVVAGVDNAWESFTPRAILAYHPHRDLLVYGSYSEGFKSGAFDIVSFATTPLRSEKVKAYELGIKTQPAAMMTFNAAAFIYDRSDVQVQAQDPATGLPSLQNAAKARTYGAEAEVTVRPITGLSLQAGVTYLDAKYRRFPNALVYSQIPVPTGAVPGSLGYMPLFVDVSGQRVEGSPEWTVSLAGSYTIELPGGGSIRPSANLYTSSSSYFDRSVSISQESYTLLNAAISWQLSGSKGFSLDLWGRNLTDETYLLSNFLSFYGDSAHYNEPRTYGVTARFDF